MKDLLLITPPFTQLNTPYPATAYIKGFLNTKGISSYQVDLGIEVILELFTVHNLEFIFDYALANKTIISDNAQRIFQLRNEYLSTIKSVIEFLQGDHQTLARQISTLSYLPMASRYDQLDELEWAFGNMGIQDKAKHLATLYLEDLSDFIVECVDENFGFSRYAERLGRSANSFDELYEYLQCEPTFIDGLTLTLLKEKIESTQPKLICFSVPFPGNLYSAFRCAQFIKSYDPHIKIAMGGGFPNTELRSVSDVRVFEFFDYISLDDGELPLELIVSNVLDPSENNPNRGFYKRTFLLEDNQVIYNNFSLRSDYKQADLGTPDYTDLLLERYISVIEIANPMHSLWSDGRWNKLTMAHGCYWGKCTFCDVSLDYIKLYEPATATLLVDRMEEIIAQTGEYGFHFVDEAAPPALMRALALEIIKRNLKLTWWTNIRFEKSFTPDLCRLLQESGCIAVSGGLEVASDRLLDLIQKGVTVAQVAQVTDAFTEAGILVHAYLMYGYPTQTIQETIDSLEMVRQLFELGVLQSGFWHQFALTAHSPIGLDPETYGIKPIYNEITFANNDIAFIDRVGIDHDMFSQGLKKSLFNYMHGLCFDFSLQDWFDFKVPSTSIPPDYIEQCLIREEAYTTKPNAKIIWISSKPSYTEFAKKKRGKMTDFYKLIFHSKSTTLVIDVEKAKALWLIRHLEASSAKSMKTWTYTELKSSYELEFEEFELFWFSKEITKLKAFGWLVL